MTDIIERLRLVNACAAGCGGRCSECPDTVAREAADEIERLRAERDRLREALRWFIDNDETNQGDEPMPEFGGQSWNEINAYWIDGLNRARAALGENDA